MGMPLSVGEKENQPFQLSFNRSLKVDFQYCKECQACRVPDVRVARKIFFEWLGQFGSALAVLQVSLGIVRQRPPPRVIVRSCRPDKVRGYLLLVLFGKDLLVRPSTFLLH
jgi:hypothetical protein